MRSSQHLLDLVRAYPLDEPIAGHACPYYWRFGVTGNPTSGSAIWTADLDGDEEDITITATMTKEALATHLLTLFGALAEDDFVTRGGPWPTKPLDIEWKRTFVQIALDAYDGVTAGTLSLNLGASAWMHDINPR